MTHARRAAMAFAVMTSVLFGAVGPAVATGTHRSGPFREFSLPDLEAASPYGIVLGPDGNFWFTMFLTNEIGRITPAGVITEFPSPLTQPLAITVGPDNALWYSANGSGVARMTTDGVVTATYPTAARGDGITTGPDGNLWISGGGTITRMSPHGHTTDYPVDGYSLDIVTGPDGNLWFTDPADFFTDGRIGRITPHGKVTQFAVPPNPDGHTEPWGITAGPDGNLWFADQFDQVGKVTPAGVFTMFPTPPRSNPLYITAAADGNLWFTTFQGGGIVRITPDGVKTGFGLPAPFAGPHGITAGPHKSVWFTEDGNNYPSNRIGMMKVCSSFTGTVC